METYAHGSKRSRGWFLTSLQAEGGATNGINWIYDLSSGERNDKLVKKIYKTLTAMGNSEKNAVGYVLIGVADNFEDAEKISRK